MMDVLGFSINLKDNSDEVLRALENAVRRGLEACGETAVGYAQADCPVDTGNLRGSITYAVDDRDCYIGTNVEYAPYIEFGTGIYSTEGGRLTPWVYQDADGNWHRTEGMKPQPFLKPAAADHGQEYHDILEESLKNA